MVVAIKANELIAKAENQLEIIKSLHRMFDSTLSLEVDDMYLVQLTVLTGLIQRVKAVNPQWVIAKLNAVLVELVMAKATINKPDLTWEKVTQVTMLFDLAKALGWTQPQLESPSSYFCQVCGYVGRLGVDIVERPYYDVTLHRDNTRYECENIQACLTRTGR